MENLSSTSYKKLTLEDLNSTDLQRFVQPNTEEDDDNDDLDEIEIGPQKQI